MSDLKSNILAAINLASSSHVWTPADFARLGKRDAVDKTLQRLSSDGTLRRIDRGLYDRPRLNSLTAKPTVPDYREIVDAIARRDQLRILVDGLTAANDLGFTNVVPAKVVVYTDVRRRNIQLGNLTIQFKQAAPSRLYWAGRPAMRLVQALRWLRDTVPHESWGIDNRIRSILTDPTHGQEIAHDLVDGFHTLPGWMQKLLAPYLSTSFRERQMHPQENPHSPSSAT
ncbi:DUF6088 family protein [Pandoraea oxalativorans]|uniref:Uncharacterized protein n=1 Tax=Pandoraea oxalativorans TaxID=573737 RepID=A0A192B136_9BURK|nr:DUF6088 family protein [Pandoraea oxalativorans]ANJ86776.1 hypothetical protein MB84_27285 [Pandoraea oxalativorans]